MRRSIAAASVLLTLALAAPATRARNGVKGTPCANACIAKEKTCHHAPAPTGSGGGNGCRMCGSCEADRRQMFSLGHRPVGSNSLTPPRADKKKAPIFWGLFDGPPETRTRDPLIKSNESEHTTKSHGDVVRKKSKG